jgi:endonuclease YncB( thermonuclease family)
LLHDLARGQQVVCRICRQSRDGHAATGTCQLGDGTHLSRALVSAGLARDCPAVSGGKLARDETAASKEIPLPAHCRPSMRRGPMPPMR